MNQQFFATTAKGVETVLARELVQLGAQNVVEEPGGVGFSGSLEMAYRANLWLRTANRILMPVSEFACPSEQYLYDGVHQIDWGLHLTQKMTFAVDANVRNSNIKHSKYAALRAKDAIADQFREKIGARPSVDPTNPDLRINVHISRNHCILSLDLSGDSLHKRGYRVMQTEAPLKETLAAAIVDFTGWDMRTPFIDPMCGSGTIVIEAALKAANVAPGLLHKKFGFQRWLDFNGAIWDELVREAQEVRKGEIEAQIIASDISGKAIEAASMNARAASVDRFITFKRMDVRDLTPPPDHGVIVVNPPYGERLGQKAELAPLYRAIGDVFKKRCKGYTGYVFTGNLDLAKHIGLRASRRIILYNGPIESRLLRFELY